jgi:hypothetical protein
MLGDRSKLVNSSANGKLSLARMAVISVMTAPAVNSLIRVTEMQFATVYDENTE